MCVFCLLVCGVKVHTGMGVQVYRGLGVKVFFFAKRVRSSAGCVCAMFVGVWCADA